MAAIGAVVPAIWIALSSSLASAYVTAPVSTGDGLLHRAAWPRRAEAHWTVTSCRMEFGLERAAGSATGVLRDLWFNFECAAENLAHATASPFAKPAQLPSLADPAVAMHNSQLSDCPDVEGQTISHWSEDEGSVRWALVEPDLAALQEEEQFVAAACEQLRSTLRSEFACARPILCLVPAFALAHAGRCTYVQAHGISVPKSQQGDRGSSWHLR